MSQNYKKVTSWRVLDDAPAAWRAVRDLTALGAAPGDGVWRLSLPPSAAPACCAALAAISPKLLLDWGGGLVWFAAPPDEATHRAVIDAATRGSYMLFRGPDSWRGSVPVITEEGEPMRGIALRVKAAMDPAGILNPGRMRAGH